MSEKLKVLQEYLKELGSVAVAFSSGVDSTFLLKMAHDILGDRVLAVTVDADFFPKRELEEAKAFCETEGIRQIIVKVDEQDIEGFSQNPKNRCYICKYSLFKKIKEVALKNQIAYVVEGSNVDDEGDYRPGMQAIRELQIKSPLRYVGLTKQEIRIFSRELGLSTWEKPSFACLASRFVYGEAITKEKLSMVERAEQLLLELGFLQIRVRIHGKMARIEVMPEDFSKLCESSIREKIVYEYKKIGFQYVTMDLQGYRTGSMNEAILKQQESI